MTDIPPAIIQSIPVGSDIADAADHNDRLAREAAARAIEAATRDNNQPTHGGR